MYIGGNNVYVKTAGGFVRSKVTRTEDGIRVEPLDEALPKRPRGATKATLDEVLARFNIAIGATYPKEQPKVDEPGSSPAQSGK